MAEIHLNINGQTHTLDTPPMSRLLDFPKVGICGIESYESGRRRP